MGGANLKERGAPTYYLGNFHQILHENEENWIEEGTHTKFYYVDPPL